MQHAAAVAREARGVARGRAVGRAVLRYRRPRPAPRGLRGLRAHDVSAAASRAARTGRRAARSRWCRFCRWLQPRGFSISATRSGLVYLAGRNLLALLGRGRVTLLTCSSAGRGYLRGYLRLAARPPPEQGPQPFRVHVADCRAALPTPSRQRPRPARWRRWRCRHHLYFRGHCRRDARLFMWPRLTRGRAAWPGHSSRWGARPAPPRRIDTGGAGGRSQGRPLPLRQPLYPRFHFWGRGRSARRGPAGDAGRPSVAALARGVAAEAEAEAEGEDRRQVSEAAWARSKPSIL